MEPTTNQHEVKNQYTDFKNIVRFFKEAEQACTDMQRLNELTDELFKHQPFLISLALGDSVDLAPEEVNEMMIFYIALWLYFRRDLRAMNRKITDSMFDKYYHANLNELSAGKLDHNEVTVLWGVCNDRFQTRLVLRQMKHQSKSAVMVGVRTLIDCFEEVTK